MTSRCKIVNILLLNFALMFLVQKAPLAAEVNSNLASADSLYQKGDCAGAIRLYEMLSKNSKVSAEDQSLSQFRSAYCHLSLGDDSDAEKGFSEYLKKHPENDEARLKYAQSLYNQEKNEKAHKEAKAVQSDSFQMEAKVLAARATLADGKAEAALSELQEIGNEGDWGPVVFYWQGVAYLNLDNEDKAEEFFKKAKNSAPSDHWVKNDAEYKLEGIRENQRRFHFSLSGGYLFDGNVAQSGGYMSMGGPANGPEGGPTNGPQPGGTGSTNKPPPGEPGSIPGSSTQTTSYTIDRGYMGSLDLTLTPIRVGPKFQLLVGGDAYATFYQSQTSYNYETINARIEADYKASSAWKFFLASNYLDTRYYYAFYQDYLVVTPGITWNISNRITAYLTVPVTWYMVARPATLVGPSLSFQYQPFGFWSITLGGSYLNAKGQAAVYSTTQPTTVDSGTAFSRYSTYGGFLSTKFYLPFGFELFAQCSLYRTSYALESPPPPPGQPATQVDARSDLMWSAQASLSRDIIAKIVSLSLSFTYTSNNSTGYQGLGSGGSVPIDSYTRPYALLTLAIAY